MPKGVDLRLTLDDCDISNLKLNLRNPRRHSDRQIKQLARSIADVGFISPAIVDRHGNVLAGHGRILACQKLGHKTIPVIQADHLSEAQAKAFAIADNRLSELSDWDDELLAGALQELSKLDLDFSIETTGFTVGEIDLRIEAAEDASDSSEDNPEPAQPVTEKPVSQPGDLWQLRDHRILCGNALDAQTYSRLMQDTVAAMSFSDPPYNVRIGGHASGLGRIHHREFTMASGEMSSAEFEAFLSAACRLISRNSRNASVHFICTDWRHIAEMIAAGQTGFSELLNLCVWCKHNAGMGSFYRSQHELVFVFKAGRGRHQNNIQLGQFGRNRTNVWSYPGINSFGRTTDEGNLLALHPTVKPVRLVADAILDCSSRGEIVLDPFLGSGTTLIAAERVGRVCRGMEIDPLYVDTIVRRWQAYTGGKAIHTATGRSFDDISADMERRNG